MYVNGVDQTRIISPETEALEVKYNRKKKNFSQRTIFIDYIM